MSTILVFISTAFSYVGPFIILLGLLIFVHELGHFSVAKWCGVRVETFSLGFGKKIFKKKVGDTTYCISLFPLGGYVKMFGDDVSATIADEDKRYSFLNKRPWQKIAVVLAGPLMNLFFAVLIFLVVAMRGEDVRSNVVGDVEADSAAFKEGFRSGDKIMTVNGVSVQTFEQVTEQLTKFHGTDTTIGVKREIGGKIENLKTTPQLRDNPNVLAWADQIGTIPGLSDLARIPVIAVRDSSIASEMGLRTHDLITFINGQKITYFRDIENALIAQSGKTLDIQIDRKVSEKSPIEHINLSNKSAGTPSLQSFGIESPELYLYQVVDGSPAALAGLKGQDKIRQIDEMVPAKWDDILNKVKSYSGQGKMKFTVEREGELKTFELEPKMNTQVTAQGGDEKRYTVGIVPSMFLDNPPNVKIKSDSFLSALQRGTEKAGEVTVMTVLSFVRLAQGRISSKSVGGVISIGQAAGETYKAGLGHYLQMMAIISINLFVLNLLPIPVLDGGHLVFYSIEGLKGSPVSIRKMEIAQQFGLAVLMSLMVFALFNDFSRLLGH